MAVFAKEEYLARVAKTKQSMQEKGIDVLISVDPANMNYLTGYDGWSFYVHQCVIVALDKEEPMWVGRGMDANGARITSVLSNESIYEYADNYVQSLERHPMDFVGELLIKHKLDKKTVGLEMDQYYFTAQAYVSLQKTLPNAKFVDATSLVNWVRVVKSDAELEFLRRAGAIAVKVMDAAAKHIRPGVRECDAASEIVRAQYAGTKEFGGDYPSIVPLIMPGEATKTPHLTWEDKPFVKDEAVLLELAGVYKHYHAPIARTIYLGEKAPQILVDTAKVVIDGLAETLDYIKPGVTAESIEAKWREAISKSGIVKESRLGYSIGVNYPPDWGEHTISFRPGDKTVMQKNMAVHLIPGIWLDEVGFEIDASFAITENGIEEFYDYPVDIIYNK
ncbi:MAG: M24 family metallopeptidase [Sphaerochaetaceae bacterium]|jgi:Xaa-Pro aminopeptidase